MSTKEDKLDEAGNLLKNNTPEEIIDLAAQKLAEILVQQIDNSIKKTRLLHSRHND